MFRRTGVAQAYTRRPKYMQVLREVDWRRDKETLA